MKARKTAFLVVEDDLNERLLVQNAFHAIGVTDPVYALSDGVDAIQYLTGEGQYGDRERFWIPTFLLIDLKMPKVNGFEFLAFIQQHPHFKVIPTIVFTSSDDPNDVTNAYLLGANSYLVKSKTLEGLCEQIRMLHDYWLKNEIPKIDRTGKLLATNNAGKLSESVSKISKGKHARLNLTGEIVEVENYDLRQAKIKYQNKIVSVDRDEISSLTSIEEDKLK